MENNLQIFKNDQFGEVRTIMKDGEPWFVAVDVCGALDIGNPSQAISRLDDDEKVTLTTNEGHSGKLGGAQMQNVISESGLYSLVLGSRKPEAKAFKRWITHDVIPTIRKTGGYVANDELFLATYLPNADEATKAMFTATLATMRSLNEKIERDKPLVQFAEHVGSTSDCLTIRQFAKIVNDETIPLGEKRLFKWLRERKYLDQNNVAYQRYIDSGYFNVREVSKNTVVGARVFPQTIVTGKGQIYLLSKLREEFC